MVSRDRRRLRNCATGLALGLGGALFCGSTSEAQPRPSFDCAKARSEVEKQICGNRELAELDNAIAEAFATLRKKLDSEANRILRAEQATFNATRDVVIDSKDLTLKEFMASHLAFLRRVEAPAAGAGPASFIGEWGNSSGSVQVKPGKDGALAVEVNTSGFGGRWVCEVSGEARLRDGRLGFSEDDVQISLARRGHALVVSEKLPPDRRMRDYCGANGAIEGGYLKLR